MKNNTAKKYLILYIIISAIFIGVVAVVTTIQTQNYTKQLNTKAAEIIGEIKKQYPEIEDENIIKILNNTENRKQGQELLEKYGITEEISAIKEIEAHNQKTLITHILILVVFATIVIVIFGVYLKQRQRKINQLDKYLQKISRRDYSLDIEECSEDELNALKNSLYKKQYY